MAKLSQDQVSAIALVDCAAVLASAGSGPRKLFSGCGCFIGILSRQESK